MEQEIEKCITCYDAYTGINIVVFTDRLVVEWCGNIEYGLFYIESPVYRRKQIDFPIKTSSMKRIKMYDRDPGRFTEHISEKYDRYENFHCIYSVSSEYKNLARIELIKYYKFIADTHLMRKYTDYDIEFIYNYA